MSDPLQQNYFELYGCPQQFSVDSQLLAQRYLELQQQYHPDRFVTASEEQKRLSLQWTARVNDAFQTLKQPLLRASYLLTLLGYPLDAADTAMDGDFLLQQMELRERLENIAAEADPLQALDEIRLRLQQDEEALFQRLEQRFAEGSAHSLRQAGEDVKQMKFLQRLREEVNEREEQLLG
ncbi:MAG: Fe-S protein assembly co-chaperone HscB [Gammaproteobacteria bacterium]|nr:Fe-S protein assembly co-chaperone HscB [Gammaproteobacteria bacterium]